MKKLLLFFNLITLCIFFYKQKQTQKKYNISLVDIESEQDILDENGLYKDENGNILPIIERFE
ncbi:hypothetical protein [Staphylococcus epidermidis]|uniref:hypothetical protein n=1 Tax=Staphylococcus epidermidis TaxID=1282 RepID=UPI0020B22619|nr:hypothetical protein [Staphylococcus epidermidis]UTF15754.1 hypothetical protein MNU56_11615 [Staphylococcus epidermidis]